MSEPIGPGDWVECINNMPHKGAFPGRSVLMVGALYCVEGVIPDDQFEDRCQDAYELVGMTMLDPEGYRAAFCSCRFRPIRDGQERIVKPEKVTA